LYVDVTLPRRALYTDGTTNYNNIATLKAAIAPREANSFVEFPPFMDTTLTGLNLHLIYGASTACKVGGKTILNTLVTIDRDYDMEIRNATTPDVGADEVNAPLPVKLLYIRASKKEKTANIRWATASEEDADYFDVERSEDGHSFDKVGTLSAAGNAAVLHRYEFTDEMVPTDYVLYYRLKMVDRDGQYTYSEKIALTNRSVDLAKQINVYPNPVINGNELSITSEINGEVTIELQDWAGKKLAEQQLNIPYGVTTVPLTKIENLGAGVYILTIKTHETQHTVKVIKQ
jgi:hypothetical protein